MPGIGNENCAASSGTCAPNEMVKLVLTVAESSQMSAPLLTLSPYKAEKPASPTVTNSRKAEIPACRSLIYSRKYRLGNLKKTCYK